MRSQFNEEKQQLQSTEDETLQKQLQDAEERVASLESQLQKLEEEKEKKRLERLEARKNVKKLSDTGFQGALKKAVSTRLTEEGSGDEIEQDEEEVSPEVIQKALSAKEINRAKLAAARKRDAEKYGEEYVDVTDDDLK